MGKMGRAIDALPDDVKDYMVRSQRWVSGMDARSVGAGPVDLNEAEKCPAVHVYAACGAYLTPGSPEGRPTGRTDDGGATARVAFRTVEDRVRCQRVLRESGLRGIGPHYDRLCERFGQRRIVRLIKQRAAATMSTEVEAPERETVPA